MPRCTNTTGRSPASTAATSRATSSESVEATWAMMTTAPSMPGAFNAVLQGGAEALGRRGRAEVDGVAHPRVRPGDVAQHLLGGLVELRHAEPDRGAGVGGEHRGAARIADDREPPPRERRLVAEQRTAVEQFLERVDTDDTGLTEQRVDHGVGAGHRGGVGRRGPRPRRAAA